MITEKDLQEAIAECNGERNPNAHTCIKLAAFLTIQNYMFGKDKPNAEAGYSYAAAPEPPVVKYSGGSEFAEIVNGRNPDEIWPIIDDLMDALRVLNPRLYDSAIRKLRG